MASTSDREIVMERVFDAPRTLVFRAFTERDHIVHWWGPNGFTNTIHEMDVRPGGVWRFIMHGPDGVDYPNKIVYREVVAPERLVYVHSDDIDGGQMFLGTVLFTEQSGKTTVTLKLLFDTKEQRDMTAKFGAIEGGNQTLGRLAEYLKTMKH